jgi:MtrB/PioB family decaheme-associated outer membrane protein
MSHRLTFSAAVIAAALAPLPAIAQEAGSPAVMASSFDTLTDGFTKTIEVGGAPAATDSFLLGKYTGAATNGSFGVANFALRQRDQYDSGGTRNWELIGTNLGLTSRSVAAKFANQGAFGVSFFYNEIPFYQSDSAASVFSNAGSARLSLPSNLPLNTTPALGAQLGSWLHPQAFHLDRKIVGGGFNVLSSGWQFATTFSREQKDGLKEQSLTVNARTDPVAFPEPVSYTTNTFDATASYNTRAAQLQLGYIFSGFSDANAAALLPSPFMGLAGQGVGAISQWALPASNTAHDLNVAGAYNLGEATRVNVNLGYGLQLQNDPLLPYTQNPAIVTEPLLRQSLDGRVRTSLAQFKINSAITRRFDVTASYTYDQRHNETPRERWVSLEEPEWLPLVNWNVPYGFTDQSARIDAGYRLPTRTRVSAGYLHQVRDRTYADVLTSTEDSARIKVSQDYRIGNAYVSYLHADRTGSAYNSAAFDFAAGNLPSTTPLLPYPNNAAQSNGYLLEPNYYLFRRVFEADRARREVKTGTTLDLANRLSLDVSGRRAIDSFGNSPFGVQDMKSWSETADLAYAMGDSLELHGFYTRESSLNDQQSLGSTGITTNTRTPQWTWTSAWQDVVDTIGVGATLSVGNVTIGPRYERSAGNTDINVVSGPGAGTSAQWMSKPVPTIVTRSSGAKIAAEYALPRNASIRVVYDYEQLSTQDPMLNTGALPAVQTLFPTAGAITNGWLVGGDASGAYHLHIVTTSVIWRF